MLIQWLGHSSFLIVSGSGTKILTDPYTPGAFGGAIGYKPIKISPDIVTVSHSHADHSCLEGLPDDFVVVSQPGTRNVKGIDFRGVESYHDTEQGALRGMNIMFAMNVDQIRVCHLGDLGHVPSGDEVYQLGEVDILMIPVGGCYTIGPADVDRTIERLNPKIVIPMHYRTDVVNLPIASVEDFTRGKENVRRLDTSEIEITKEQLPERREIIILQHAL